MSRLEELIQQLCPDGVEYRPFGKMATIIRGASPRPIKNFITTRKDGVNWIKIGDVKPGSKYIADTAEKITPEGAKKSRLVKKGDFILSNSMSFGRPYIMKTEGCIHDGWLAISNFDCYFIADFLYHLLNSNQYQHMMKQKASFGGAVQNLNADIVRELMMPVVPLEVQREIVRILDQFTELTAKLTTELTTELIARKKQYEYYRNELLTVKSDSLIYTIGELCRISRGRVISKEYIRDNAGEYPVYSSQTENDGVLGLIKGYEYDGEYLTWTTDGANAGTVFYRKGRFNITNVCGLLDANRELVRPRYLYYALSRIAGNYVSKGMGNPKLMNNVMGRIKMPIPPLEFQDRVVSILDRFDPLCNDLTGGLPAEIEARQKQYEYYRDKLLAFKERH